MNGVRVNLAGRGGDSSFNACCDQIAHSVKKATIDEGCFLEEEMGGAGLRHLKIMNEATLIIMLRQFAAG